MLNLFNTIIEMNIKASVVILFILVVRLFLKNVPKKFSYLLWTVAAFRLCIPYSFKALFSLFNVGGKESIGEQISHSVEQIPTYTPAPIVNNTVNTIVTPPIHTSPVNTPPIHTPVTTPNIDISQTSSSEIVNAVAEKSIDWGVLLMQIALIVWIVGIAAMLIYGVITYVKTYRRMQSGILTRDNIYFSDKTDTPFSMGFIKPKIYLPFGLSDEEQECIIAHEECHIKRLDHIIKLFSYLLLCVHWFNPMCWIAFNRMTYDMETSCDEMVFASGITEEKKKQYSHTLVSVGTKKRFPTPAPINFDGISNTKSRIKNVLKIRKTKIWIKVICYVLCALVLFACAADVSENITDSQSKADNAQSESDNTISGNESTQSDTNDNQNAMTKPEGLIADAIANKINIITEDGKATFINDHALTLGITYHKQAFADMDGDGYQEVVLAQNGGTGYTILREYNKKVYAYDLAYRELINLKTDGTYQSVIGNGNDSICRMSFSGSQREQTIIANLQFFADLGKELYTINGEIVPANEYQAYYEEWSNKERVVFTLTHKYEIIIEVPNQEALENGEYDTFIESEYAGLGDTMLFVASEKVTDFKVIEIDANDDFDPIVGETLYYQPELTPDGKPLYVQTYINTFSERGIQYTDKNGYIRTFQIWYDAIDGDLRLSEFSATNVNVSELVVNAINGNVKITTEDGERVYLTDITLSLPETKFTGYTFLDLDSDGTAEGILQLYNYYGYIILREYNNEVYSYFMNYRGFHLKNDSTCLSSSGASDNYIYRIEFDESTLREVVLAVCCETYESNEIVGTYEINGNAVSAEEAHTYFKQWYEKEDVSFTPFEQNGDTAPAEDIFEIGIATEEMLSDGNNIRFIDDYGENNTWHVYVKPNYNLTDFRFFVIDGTDTTVISSTMYAIDNFNTNDTFIASTYINDVTSNRGFGFIDQSGKQRFFAIVCDMTGLKESPVEALEITDSPLLSAAPYYDFESVALRFYNAYMQNDIETAKILMDSTDNECLEYFSNNVNEYNSIKRGRISLSSVINDNKGNITEANLDIAFSDTREGYENTDYMVMTLKNINGKWVITYYDFEA